MMTKNYWDKKEAQQNREKPSWRDIDQKRDQKSPQGDATAKTSAYERKRMTSHAKQELEKLFTPKKSKEQIAAWDKLLKSKGKSFTTKSEEYVALYGLPKTWSDLLSLLENPNTPFLKTVLTSLFEKIEGTPFHELDLAVGQLRILKLTAEDPELVQAIDQVLDQINLKM